MLNQRRTALPHGHGTYGENTVSKRRSDFPSHGETRNEPEQKTSIAANWKMYKTVAEAISFVKSVQEETGPCTDREVVIAPCFHRAERGPGYSETAGLQPGGAELSLGGKRRLHRRNFTDYAKRPWMRIRDCRPFRAASAIR